MIVAIVAIVIALIAVYLAFSYKQEVDDWEAAAAETVAALEDAGVELRSTLESGVAGYEQQIADLTDALEEAQTQGGISASQLEEAQQELEDTQAQLETAQADLDAVQGELEDTQAELEQTQAALDDANARLEALGELVLPNGTYVGPVLGARVEPIPAIIFQEDAAWRVAEVSTDVEITVEGQSLTLEEFAALLQSTDPEEVALANADYQVKVKGGVVTRIRTAPA
ncbi:MAG TPA: hypothetical protein VIC58_11580 [Actinomycetota bacterium]